MMIMLSEIIWWIYQDGRRGWRPHLGTESISSKTESILSLLSSTLTCIAKDVLIASLSGSYNRLGSTSVVWCSSISGLPEKSTFYLQQKYPSEAVIWSQSSFRPESLCPLTSLNIASPSPKLSPGIASKRSSVSASWSPPLQEKDSHAWLQQKKLFFNLHLYI